MIIDVELDGKTVKIELFIPDEIKKFLQKNTLDKDQILKNSEWERHIQEDLLDDNNKIVNDFERAKLVINYIHIDQDNQIRISPRNFSSGKRLFSINSTKGTFSKKFSIGYSIFAE